MILITELGSYIYREPGHADYIFQNLSVSKIIICPEMCERGTVMGGLNVGYVSGAFVLCVVFIEIFIVVHFTPLKYTMAEY